MRNQCSFSLANASDLPEILAHASAFDLDINLNISHQFFVAKFEKEIVGFGRLIYHNGFSEIATLGVPIKYQKMGIAKSLVNYISGYSTEDIFVVTVLPEFFSKCSFIKVTEYSNVFDAKVNFCMEFDFKKEEVFVMKKV